MDPFLRFIAILIAVILVIMLPLQYLAQEQDEIIQGTVDTLSAEFADTARYQGHITTEMYEKYLEALGKTGDSYDIELEVAHPVTGKEVAERDTEEEIPVLSAKYASAEGGKEYNTRLLATTHTHTKDCYAGHRHEEKSTYTHYHAHDGTCRKGNAAVMPSGICNYCNKLTHTGYMYYYFDQYYNQVFASAYWPTTCMNCDKPLSTRNNTTVYSVMYSCGYTTDLTGDGYPDEVPVGVNHAYAGRVLPQNFAGGTLRNGCFSYHTHATTYAGRFYNGTWNSDYYLSVSDDARARAEGRATYKDQWGNTLYQPYTFSYIQDWAADVMNHYGGKPCSFPGYTTISWNTKLLMKYVPAGYNYFTSYEMDFPLSINLYPRVLNGTVVFDYRVQVSVNYAFQNLLPKNMIGSDYAMLSKEGKFSKPYFTVQDLADFGNVTDIYKYFYDLILDKSSNSAKLLQLSKIPYTSIERQYYDGYSVDLYVYDYRQPLAGYARDLNLPVYNVISTSARGGVGRIDAYGDQFNLCTYSAGPVGNWNYECGQVQDDTLDCGNVVTSLSATNPSQTVYKGDPIITTAAANMLDGTAKTVSCTVSNYDSNSLGTQIVTLIYYGLVDNAKTNGTKSCTATVTVKSRKTLTSITVTPATQEIKRYTDPSFSVTAVYSDGSSNQVLGFTATGLNKTQIGVQTVNLSYTEDGVSRTTTASVTVKRLTTNCPVCGTVYELDDNDADQGCPNCSGTIVSISASPEEVSVSKGEELPIIVTAIYRDGRIGILNEWTSNYDPAKIGLQDVKISYETFTTHVMVTVGMTKSCPICGNDYALNNDGSDPGCPLCKAEVISISVEPEDITIERYGSLDITVTATFRDGHTEEVDGWSTDFTADSTGEYDVPIYYKNAVDSIHVTVLEEGLITCPYCHTPYSYYENPHGCPVCSKTLIGIEAQLRNGGNQVIYRSDLSLQVILIYRDTHREITYTGFTYTGFDSSLLGEQTVTISYMELTTTLTIEVVDNINIVICSVCGSQYYLNEDGTDPGCPYCSGGADVERAVFYFDTSYTEDIVKRLYEDGIYHLRDGDYFTVRVNVTKVSVRAHIMRLFRSRKVEDKKKENYTYGGEVII
jgi:rubrerythrin